MASYVEPCPDPGITRHHYCIVLWSSPLLLVLRFHCGGGFGPWLWQKLERRLSRDTVPALIQILPQQNQTACGLFRSALTVLKFRCSRLRSPATVILQSRLPFPPSVCADAQEPPSSSPFSILLVFLLLVYGRGRGG